MDDTACGAATRPPRTTGRRAVLDECVWRREMTTLRRIGLVLGAALVAVVTRMVIDGPGLVDGLIAALILVLLMFSLVLRRQGRRLRAGAPTPTKRAGRL
jgi:hypothetical protein